MIRRAHEGDAETLTDLAVRTFRDTFAGTCSDVDLEMYIQGALTVQRLSEELSAPGNSFFLAIDDSVDLPVGYVKLRTGTSEPCVSGPGVIELERLYVDRQVIGHGVGAALMRTALDAARTTGHRTVWLGVWEYNHRAIAFYERWGFRVVGDHAFRVGSDDQTDLIMQRSLGEEDPEVRC